MANRKACYGSNKAFAADMKKMVNNPLLRFIFHFVLRINSEMRNSVLVYIRCYQFDL